MTDIRELLREATADIRIEHTGPVQDVRRATTRRRRTWAATGLAVVAVAAAIAVPLTLSPGTNNTHGPPPTSTGGVLARWAETNVGGVAAGYGSIWALECCGGSTAASWVDRLEPIEGTRIARVHVPGPTAQIAAGAGFVWTIGATDGGRSEISAIDPRTSQRVSLRLPNPQAEPVDIAFARGYAWVTFRLLNQVWRLRPITDPKGAGAAFERRRVIAIGGGPYDITTTGGGELWVQSLNTNTLRRLVPTPDGGRIAQRVRWPGHIYSQAGRSSVWASTSSYHSLVRLEPGALAGCSSCAQILTRYIKGQQIKDALSTPRGLFVSTYESPGSRGHVDFFDNTALGASDETPTARIVGGGALAADGDGVVVGSSESGLVHWVPAG